MSARIEFRGDALYVVLDNAARRNALDDASFTTLREAVRVAERDKPAAFVITGAGDTFTAGGDLLWFSKLAAEDGRKQLLDVFVDAANIMWALEELDCPIIAGVNGVCVAGGLEIVCFADIVVATHSATFADGHARVGLLPLAGTVDRLVARVGSANACRMLLTGTVIDAAEACRIGLVSEIVPDGHLPEALDRICQEIAARPAPVTAAMTRLARRVDKDRKRARQKELDEALANAVRPHVQECLQAFRERREPNFAHQRRTESAAAKRRQP